MHQLKGFVDALYRHYMGDQVVDIDFALHVPVHDFGHIGAASGASKCVALSVASGHELKGAG
jgi:hypothetical protein